MLTAVTKVITPLITPLQMPTLRAAATLPVRNAAINPPIAVSPTAPNAKSRASAEIPGWDWLRFPKTEVPPRFPRTTSEIHAAPMRSPKAQLSGRTVLNLADVIRDLILQRRD